MEKSIVRKGFLPALLVSLFLLIGAFTMSKANANTVNNTAPGTQVAWWGGYGYYHGYYPGRYWRPGYVYYGPRYYYGGPRWYRNCWYRYGRMMCARRYY